LQKLLQKRPSAASRNATDDRRSQARRIASELDKVLDGSAPQLSRYAGNRRAETVVP
jgi:hypothetical protein